MVKNLLAPKLLVYILLQNMCEKKQCEKNIFASLLHDINNFLSRDLPSPPLPRISNGRPLIE